MYVRHLTFYGVVFTHDQMVLASYLSSEIIHIPYHPRFGDFCKTNPHYYVTGNAGIKYFCVFIVYIYIYILLIVLVEYYYKNIYTVASIHNLIATFC